jgi:MinD superfamily P-loop ATPase
MKIAVASGKGGTGKTLVSTNLFFSLQLAGMKVSLVDCDAEEPNVGVFIKGEIHSSSIVRQKIPVIDTDKCVFCGKCFEYCNYHAIVFLPPAKFIQVVEDLCHDCGACLYACEFNAITEKDKNLGTIKKMNVFNHSKVTEGKAEVGVYSPVPVIKQAIDSLLNEPLTILDSPPGISCPFIVTVDRADFVILVTEPTPFGLNDLKLSVAALETLHKPFGVIVNKAGLGSHEVYDWLKEKNIPLLMEIPFDREIARTYSEGNLLVEENWAYHFQFAELISTINHLMNYTDDGDNCIKR